MIDEKTAANGRLAAAFAASVGLDAQGPTVTIPAGTVELDTGPIELRERLVARFERPLCGAELTLHRDDGTPVLSALVDGFATATDHDRDVTALLRLAHAAVRTYDLDRTPQAAPPLTLARVTEKLVPRAPGGAVALWPDEDDDPTTLLLTYGPMRVSVQDRGFAVWERFAWDDAGSQTAVIFEEAGHWGPAGMTALVVETFEYTDTLRNGPAALFTTPGLRSRATP
ncbi:hypothetical protein ACFZBU_42300 [Embleya sp. NPDC008237]|uniref:hypothetical protein n=1 Tax=Embleya sp. NPDC008237 TaxID=3363978 RepID=UPI0036EF030D